jgi:hypothetical protein
VLGWQAQAIFLTSGGVGRFAPVCAAVCVCGGWIYEGKGITDRRIACTEFCNTDKGAYVWVLTYALYTHMAESSTGEVVPTEVPLSQEDSAAIAAAMTEDGPQAKSLECLDCGKLFKNVELANYHAEKSGHENFEESVEEVDAFLLT